ncbi:MAG: methionine--tRNA ligase subunit beta [Fimbriimonas ginsengisoli]|nr:methionine--tRNA ligase subunit beta [Fimbriimonas ginsengisoli]
MPSARAAPIPDSPVELEAQAAIRQAKEGFETAMEDFRVHEAAESALALVRFLNKYIDRRAPWALAKAQDPAVGSVIRSMLLCLRAVEGLIRPILPSTADAIARQLGVAPTANWKEIGTQSSLPTKTALMIPEPMFPRLELATRRPEMKTPAPTEEPKTDDAQIGIDEFKKVQLRVARILEAEPLEGSDKLMRLQVIVDGAKRQIVAGIRKNYDPLDLIGRQIVVVANLKPAVVRGAESQGMLLAAVDEDGGAILLQPDRETPESAVVR